MVYIYWLTNSTVVEKKSVWSLFIAKLSALRRFYIWRRCLRGNEYIGGIVFFESTTGGR